VAAAAIGIAAAAAGGERRRLSAAHHGLRLNVYGGLQAKSGEAAVTAAFGLWRGGGGAGGVSGWRRRISVAALGDVGAAASRRHAGGSVGMASQPVVIGTASAPWRYHRRGGGA